MSFIIKVLISSFSVIVAALLLNGVHIYSYLTAIVVAFVLAILNMIVKPILVVLTIPISIVTFGLFLLVINALMALLASSLVSGFEIQGFWAALWFSLIVSFINYLIQIDDRKNRRSYR